MICRFQVDLQILIAMTVTCTAREVPEEARPRPPSAQQRRRLSTDRGPASRVGLLDTPTSNSMVVLLTSKRR